MRQAFVEERYMEDPAVLSAADPTESYAPGKSHEITRRTPCPASVPSPVRQQPRYAPAETLRALRPRRGRLAEGDEAEGLRPQVARTPEGPPAVPVPLRGGALARVRCRPGRARGALPSLNPRGWRP